jgi:histidine ammonia-lyase
VQQPFDARVHQVKPQSGQPEAAAALRDLLDGSEILADPTGRVQDGYSVRCTPQILGPSLATLLFFAEQGECLAAGNFHGQALAMALDFLAIATAEVASLAERHTNRLLNPVLSGLPDFLIEGRGVNSGLMVAQYTQAALLGENRVLCHPAVVDNVSVSADQEDHVCMGSVCVRKYKEILRNTQVVLAVQLLCAAQALDFRLAGVGMTSRPAGVLALGRGTRSAYEQIRKRVSFMEQDRPLMTDINIVADLVRSNELLGQLSQQCELSLL